MLYSTWSTCRRSAFGGIACVAVLWNVLAAQTGAPRRILEITDIRPAESNADWVSVGILPNGYVRIHNASLKKLVAVAYGLADSAVTGGPTWIDSDRFE